MRKMLVTLAAASALICAAAAVQAQGTDSSGSTGGATVPGRGDAPNTNTGPQPNAPAASSSAGQVNSPSTPPKPGDTPTNSPSTNSPAKQ
jgi:hypothetical protein